MRNGESIVYLFFAVIGLLSSCVEVQAGSVSMPKEPIVIGVLNPVRFDHVLHRSMEISCGRCHHDSNHEPRIDEEIFALANGKELHCKNCHNNDLPNQFLQRRREIFHVNCRTCHAVGINGKRGPRRCNGCHYTKDDDWWKKY